MNLSQLRIITLLGLLSASAYATVALQTTGTTPNTGNPYLYKANLNISGDVLTLTLTNDSPQASKDPFEILSGFYFDILKNGTRPTLNYQSAFGDVYLTDRSAPDALSGSHVNITSATLPSAGWQFKTFTPASPINLGFGIATAGYGTIIPASYAFNGSETGSLDYSIYHGDVTTNNLSGKLLVLDSASFIFTGLTGYSEANIVGTAVFGTGTGPDIYVPNTPVPEPTVAFLGLILGGTALWRRKRRA